MRVQGGSTVSVAGSAAFLTTAGAPVSDVSVLVVPKDRAYWYDGSRRVVSARPDADGRFTLGGRGYVSLPAGDYVLVTVDDLGRDEQYDPSFLATVVNAGIPFTLAAGERKVQDLVVQK